MRKGQREVTRKLSSEILFRFSAMCFTVFSPHRDCRYCNAPKPGKEKQKSYDYRSAILIVHGFRSFLSVFTQVLRKRGREVTRKIEVQLVALPPSAKRGGQEGVGVDKARMSDARALCCLNSVSPYVRTMAMRWRNSSSTSPGMATVWAISSRNNVW